MCSRKHNLCDSFAVWADWGSFSPPSSPDLLHTYHLYLTVIPLTDDYLFPPVHVYRSLFFYCYCLVFTTIFGCTASFWALRASGNTAFINNSYCLSSFFFSPQMSHILSLFSFSDSSCIFLSLSPPSFLVTLLFFFFLSSDGFYRILPFGEQKGGEHPASAVSEGAGELLCIAK